MAEIPDEVRELFTAANYAHVATLMPDGSPHSVAVWTGLEGDHVVFFTQVTSQKARNLERDPRVAISITDHDNPYRSARIRGRVVATRRGEAAMEVIDRLAVRYTGEPFPMRGPNSIVYEIEPLKLSSMQLPFVHRPAAA
ncbi:MAG TPA: PPOX class F420-dependent oxidoreductase [Solirubrobacteraceae bacterium]|nr:PPOX class F420-dependent oxidoreductase [Solirubrobacteraceae bacterium]